MLLSLVSNIALASSTWYLRPRSALLICFCGRAMEVVVAIRAYCFPMRKKDECEHEHWRPAVFLFILLWLLYFRHRCALSTSPFLSSSVQHLPPVTLIVQEG